ncbi:MAG: VOC family protein [Actinomycetota bacterium]|nr:VOC family protein [Actinomycetota bacterium]
MRWLLEVIVVPVSDVDRAKRFYAEQLGFVLDHDMVIDADNRIVQLTPPGSGCSVVIGSGVLPPMEPGSIKGLQLVVADVRAARAELVGRGVAVSEVQIAGPSGFRPAEDDESGTELDNVGFFFFDDPDGNGWGVQQISARG